MTPLRSVSNYNNFYEFTTDKDGVAEAAAGFKTDRLEGRGRRAGAQAARVRPRRPAADQPARGARLPHALRRGWSMVIPWAGFSLSKLLARSSRWAARSTSRSRRCSIPRACRTRRPTCSTGRTSRACASTRRCTRSRCSRPGSTATSCRRRTARRCGWSSRGSTASRASSRSSRSRSWRRSRRRPGTTRRRASTASSPTSTPSPHPRWSQATEQRIGESGRRKTLMFNGYADRSRASTPGMDLDVHF